jgi:Holliday junction resolvase RusA-like endonuclease
MPIELRVFGEPEAQPRPRWGMGHFYSPKTAFWKAVFMAAKAHKPKPRFEDTPLEMDVVLFFSRPKSKPAWAHWKTTKPDVDNVAKAVMDAMTSAGWWDDDAIIVKLNVQKIYASDKVKPGAIVTIEPCQTEKSA